MSGKHQPKILLKSRPTDDSPAGPSTATPRRTPTILANAAPQIAGTSKSSDSRHGAPSKTLPATTAPDPYSYTPMDGSLVLLKNHNAINYRTLDFLHETNQDYVVIGTIGMPGVGKSTVLNLLNTNLYSPDQSDNKTDCIFPVHGAINITGENEVRMHITEDRLILLDCCEPVFGHARKDFIQHEQDELKKLMILLRICHVIFVVQEEYYNIRLMRTLMWAEMMTQVHSKLPTKLVFIRNKVVPHSEYHDPRERMINLYRQMFLNASSFSVMSTSFGGDSGMQEEEVFNYVEFPVLEKGCDTVVITEHLKETILLLRQMVYAGRNTIMGHNSSEKAWGQALVKLVDCPESNFFVDKYEKLKEKYNLHNHVKIVEHPYRDSTGLHFVE
ncbi:nonsense-mediated mRNA decay factor SMG9 [Anopheles moucheti]|uniref:nonsense-mediated mRNA decay factor SMG9 n=1 Tax=Anopheles moucheti TaxID=186751 RepID=UPI0022F13CEA|nr:nonsense-mediated mRNA decay factor SMG9 [Anopheles moucheti]